MASNIAIQISANTQQAVAGIQSVNQKLDQLQKEGEETRKSFVSVAAGFAAVSSAAGVVAKIIGTVVKVGTELVSAYSAQELAERKLQTTLRATQNAIGMTAGELFTYADALSKVTTYSDQEIIAVEQMLAATRKISSDIMPEATKAVLDMATATGDDAAGAAKDLAQALSDPAGEIESLKEKGIQLTDEQAENIKKVQEQNGLYEAQKLLLEQVAGTYGGMAEAISDTDTGKLEKIGNVWQDIKEGLGEGLLNSIGPALDWLYERLLDIEEWINDINLPGQVENTVKAANGSTPDFSAYSDTQLIKAINPHQLSTGGYAYDGEQDVVDAVINELLTRGVNFPGADNGLTEVMKTVRAWALEMSERNPVGQFLAMNANSAIPKADLIKNNVGVKFSENDLLYWDYYQNLLADVEASRTAGLKAPSDISPARAALDGKLGGWKSVGGGSSGSGLAGGKSGEETPSKTAADFISENSSLSVSAQIDAINDKIRETSKYRLEVDPDSAAYKQLTEINDALWEQKEALMSSGGESKTYSDKLQEAFEKVDQFMSPILSIGDSFATIMQNMADAAEDKLSKIQEKWDEYFDDLDEKQGRQADSLNAMLASGYISYEDYIDSMNALDDARAEAEEKAAEEEEEQRKKANELGKAAFIANQVNSIAEASMNIAQGVTEAIAQGGIAGIALGSIVAAAGAAQIAAIASQQYTPLAAGGIVTSPTHALIGEGGSPEAILPLNEQNMDKYGFGGASGGVINISISIGAVYSKESLADEIFKGIERAQRTGALPAWRYTA